MNCELACRKGGEMEKLTIIHFPRWTINTDSNARVTSQGHSPLWFKYHELLWRLYVGVARQEDGGENVVGIGPQLNLLISAKSVYVVVAIIEVQTEISTQYYISQEKFIELIIRLLERNLRRTAARWQLLRNPDALLHC
jgi:hypothetical protein